MLPKLKTLLQKDVQETYSPFHTSLCFIIYTVYASTGSRLILHTSDKRKGSGASQKTSFLNILVKSIEYTWKIENPLAKKSWNSAKSFKFLKNKKNQENPSKYLKKDLWKTLSKYFFFWKLLNKKALIITVNVAIFIILYEPDGSSFPHPTINQRITFYAT